MKISTLLDHIDLGTLALPEFQRGYVWNRDQVRGLMASLYRRHPVGSLLVWATLPNQAKARGGAASDAGTIKLLLDGQQRITSLYGIVRGRPPRFFEGNAEAFTGLRFHLGSETFAFYSPLKMQDDPLWTDVTAVMQEGVGPFITRFAADPAHAANLNAYINRLARVAGILDIDLHVEEVIGADKTVDVVVDIFNRVNSGGTKLSKGDLALAKVCAEWPEARAEMRLRLEKWRKAGFQFRLELLLRCMTTILTGEAMFDKLAEVTADEVRDGLHRAAAAVDKLLDLIGARLGLDHDRVLGSHYSFPLMAAYLDRRGGTFADWRERDRLLYWYIHSFLWGRYAGSTETVLNQDLAAIERPEEALDRLIALLRQNRGDLRLTPDDFAGWSRNARFYPLLYMMTRVCRARDWGSGLDLSAHMLSRKAALHMHHIFPKARLYKASYPRSEVNALANFTFLTWDTNVKVGDRLPEDYLPEYLAKHPGAVQSHWIPEDPALWRIGNYADFLAARRALLAAAANEFLDRLLHGGMAEVPAVAEAEPTAEAAPGGIAGPEEEAVLAELNEWVAARGLPDGECPYELADPADGTPLAVLDLAWPDGLQPRLSQPVALLLDEAAEVHAAALRAGFRVFDDAGAFRAYVVREVLAAEDTSAAAD